MTVLVGILWYAPGENQITDRLSGDAGDRLPHCADPQGDDHPDGTSSSLIFFRVLGERYIPFLLFQSLLGAIVASVVAFMGTVAGGRKLGLLSGPLVAFNSELISMSRMMLTETIFSFLLVVTALVFFRIMERRKGGILPLVAGCLLGLAALCRPVAFAWGACWHWLCS